jgi:hypothetical protein
MERNNGIKSAGHRQPFGLCGKLLGPGLAKQNNRLKHCEKEPMDEAWWSREAPACRGAFVLSGCLRNVLQ